MAYSYKGSINFGLVYIPIKLETAVKQSEISFNQLDKKTKSRVRYQKTCDACGGRILNNDDIVKAYNYEEGKYVIFDDSDFEKIKSKKDKSIVIEQFADLYDIDPIFFNKPYYVVPTGGEKAFSLLTNAMKSTNKVAIAKTVLGQKETLIALRESNGELLLYTLYFQEEIKKSSAPKIEQKTNGAELDMAVMIIKGMTKRFNAKDYKDEYTEKVKAAISAKVAGKEIASPQEKQSNVTDLMEALTLSVKRLNAGEGFLENTAGAKKSTMRVSASKATGAKEGKRENGADFKPSKKPAVISDLKGVTKQAKITALNPKADTEKASKPKKTQAKPASKTKAGVSKKVK